MPTAAKPVSVLLVEDNPHDANAVRELFAAMKPGDFSLRVSGSLRTTREEDEKLRADIFLLDLNLPDSFGPSTFLKAQKFCLDRPIIVMTGLHEDTLRLELIKKGAQDFLVKGKMTADGLYYALKYSIERANIERQLLQREMRLRSMLEKMPDGVLVVRPGGTVVFANRGAEVLLGCGRGKILSEPFRLETLGDKPRETETPRLDGRLLPTEVRAAEILWGGENCRLVILRDLAPARMLERTRDEFISMVSHELRAPLTIVKESLDLVYDGTAGEVTDKQKEILKMGLDNAGRLNRMIDAIQDIAKIEAGVMPLDMARTDLGEMLRGTASDFSRLAAQLGQELRAAAPPDPLEAWCDQDKIREVLVNLVSNALKFTPRGGRISLSLRAAEGGALFCVENSGPGIDPEDLPKLFLKFSRVGRAAPGEAKGTGLGLAISRSIVEMHHGRIWAESEPGKNCRFCFTLPAAGLKETVRRLVRREIGLSAGTRHFCAVTVRIPPGNSGPGAAREINCMLKDRLRGAHAVIRMNASDFTLLLPAGGLSDCAKAVATIEKGLSGAAGLQEVRAADCVSALLYPEDFADEEAFCRKAFGGGGEFYGKDPDHRR